MTAFEREMPAFRLVETHHGDDLAAVAYRELGDASQWPTLVWLNDLIPPYLTDAAEEAGAGVLLTGALIRVPSSTGTPVEEPDRAQVFGRDCGLWGKQLAGDENGDLAILAGTDNLVQQLRHAIITPRGQLRRHPGYGCLVWSLHGTVQGPTGTMLGGKYVKATLESDYRVGRVVASIADAEGDALRITATAEAIDGGAVDLTSDIPDLLPLDEEDPGQFFFPPGSSMNS